MEKLGNHNIFGLCLIILQISSHLRLTNGSLPLPKACPDGFVQHLDRCYYLSSSRTWTDAQDFCKTLIPLPGTSNMATARLVEPHGPWEAYFVVYMATRTPPWIGLFQDPGPKVFKWLSGAPVTWTNWGYTRSFTMTENAVMIENSGYWHRSGSQTHATICEIVLNNAVSQPCKPIWFMRHKEYIPGVPVTLTNVSFTRCLGECLHSTNPSCQSVQYNHPTKSCHISSARDNFTSSTAASDINWDYLEVFCSDCNTELIGNLPNTSFFSPAAVVSDQEPNQGRIFNQFRKMPMYRGTWLGTPYSDRLWLRIDLGKTYRIEALMLQGSPANEFYRDSDLQFLTKWRFLYSADGENFNFYSEDGNITDVIFPGCTGAERLLGIPLREPVFARFLMINVVAYTYEPSVRFGALGCPSNYDLISDWKHPLGMSDGFIHDSQMTTSSEYHSYPPHRARLPLKEMFGYQFPFFVMYNPGWWQVDFILPHHLKAMSVLGRHFDGFIQYVKRAHLTMSNDSFTWTAFMDGKKIAFSFDNEAKTKVELGLLARYLRIHVGGTGDDYYGHRTMRVEFYGYPIDCPDSTAIYSVAGTPPACPCHSHISMCKTGSSAVTLELSKTGLHHLTGIKLLVLSGSASEIANSIEISHSHNGTVFLDIPRDMMFIFSDSGSVTVKMKRARRAIKLRIKIGTAVQNFCSEVKLFSCKAEACPPGFIHMDDMCYYFDQSYISMTEDMMYVCRNASWVTLNTLATFNNSEHLHMLNVACKYFPTTSFWTGLRGYPVPDPEIPGSRFTYRFLNGNPSRWRRWYPGQMDDAPNKEYGITLHYGLWDVNMAEQRPYACETKAAYSGESWFGRWERRLENVPTVTLTGLSIAECMRACEHYKDFDCRAVSVDDRRTLRTCQLHDGNSNTPGANVKVEHPVHYFEKFKSTTCNKALIWGPDGVGEDYVSASTWTSDHPPEDAKLDSGKYWRVNDPRQQGTFHQADLRQVKNITRLVMQPPNIEGCYVREFYIMYSNDSLVWKTYRHQFAKHKVFEGNPNQHELSAYSFEPSLVARFVRIYVKSYQGCIAMSYELYGCDLAELAYTKDVGCAIELTGVAGGGHAKYSKILVNGANIGWPVGCSCWQTWGVVVLNMSSHGCRTSNSYKFSPHESVSKTREMMDAIAAFPNGTVYAGTVDDVGSSITNEKKEIMAVEFSKSGIDVHRLTSYSGIAFIAKKGDPAFTKYRIINNAANIVQLSHIIKSFPKGCDDKWLGMVDRSISVNQLSSSRIVSNYNPPNHGRLFNGWDWSIEHGELRNAWMDAWSPGMWYQIDLSIIYDITGIITQGAVKRDYYIKEFKVHFSTDFLNWVSQANPYEANVVEVTLPIYTIFKPFVTGRAIRIEVVSYTGNPSIRLELTGKPVELERLVYNSSKMTILSSPTGGLCAVDTFCANGWLVNTASAWVEINLGMLHFITTVYINTTNEATWSTIDFDIKKHSDQQWKKIAIDLINAEKGNGSTRLHFTHHITAWLLKMTLSSLSRDGRVKLAFHAEKAPACPPGMFLNRDICVFPHAKYSLNKYFQIACEDIEWTQRGYQYMIKDLHDLNHIFDFMTPYSTTTMLAGFMEVNNKWQYDDGSSVTANTPWSGGTVSGVLQNYCGYMMSQAEIHHSTNCRRNGACQTRPALEPEDKCIPIWYYSHEKKLPEASRIREFNGIATGQCLHLCLHLYRNECIAVTYYEDTLKCHLFNTNSLAAYLQTDNKAFTYEWHCHEQTDVKVFRDLAGRFTYTLIASSEYSNTWRTEEAPMIPGYSKYAWSSSYGYQDGKHFITVLFDKYMNLTGMLAIGGRRTSGDYVKTMYLWYWNDYGWQGLGSSHVDSYVDVNWERHRGTFIRFPWRIITQQVRLISRTNSGYFVIKFELYGQLAERVGTVQDYPLGMETKEIGGYQIKASTFLTSTNIYPPSGVRMGSTIIGSLQDSWRPSPSNAPGQWIQVDLIFLHLITRLRTSSAGTTQATTRYTLQTSSDGISWANTLTDASACVFRTRLYLDILTNFTTPVTARYVRLYPTAFNSYHDLKIEIYGSPVGDRLIEKGFSAKLTSSMPASFCWDNQDPTYAYRDEYNCSAWCIETSSQVNFQIDLRKIYSVSRVFLMITKQGNESITSTIQLGVNATTFVQELDAYWQKNGTSSSYIFHRAKKARFIKIMLQPTASERFCLYADVNACKVHDCPVTYMQHKKSCFRVYDIAVTPYDAQSVCEEDGKAWLRKGQLAKLNDMSKVDTIHGLLQQEYTQAWVGASYQSGSWKWSDTDAMSWAPWSSLADTALTAKSAAYYSVLQRGMINDYIGAKKPFICELESLGNNPGIFWVYQKETILNETDVSVTGVETSDCLYTCQSGDQSGCSSIERDIDANNCSYVTWSRYSGQKGIHHRPGKKSTYWEVHNAGSCSRPVVDSVYNPTITASSSLDASNGPEKVVYGANPVTFWQTTASDTAPYIQFEFNQVMTAARILVAGNGEALSPKYVTSFSVEISLNNVKWEKQLDGYSQTYTFAGNYDAETPYSVLLVAVPLFKLLKIFPLTWQGAPAMRLQMFGCHFVEPLTCTNAFKPTISVPGSPDFQPPCHTGWTVIMRHEDPAFTFKQPWSAYKNGFGDVASDLWIGNVLLSHLTKNRFFDLRLEIWTQDGRFYSSEYNKARVENELQKFSLSVQSLEKGMLDAGGLVSSGLPFSTHDADIDGCSQANGEGGFWFNSTACSSGSLTSDLKTKTYWTTSRGTKVFAKKVLMKIMPTKAHLDNIAAMKTATRSSDNPSYPASLATDLDISQDRASGSCTIGVAGTDPWWRVDLERSQAVKSVNIITFSECCADNLHDFDIYVGSTLSSGNFTNNGYKLCKHYTGTVPSGDVITVNCSSVITGRYIAIQIPGDNKVLTICEVQAFAERESKSIYQSCERNSQCTHKATECRPKRGSMKEIYTCECQLYTRDINATCYPEADMQPLIQGITFPKDGIVRNHAIQGSMTVRISHNGGATISNVSSGSNFDVGIFLVSEEPDYMNEIFIKLPAATYSLPNKPTFLKEMKYETSFDITLNVTINIDINLCFNMSHLCVNVMKGSTGFYYETNSSNNIHCFDIKQYANCQPDLDPTLSSINLPGATKLNRGLKSEIPFSLELTLGSTTYDIVEPATGYSNYEVSFLYSPNDISSFQEFVSRGLANMTKIAPNDANKLLSKNSQATIVANVTSGPSDSGCEQMQYLCFALKNTKRASYNDTNLDNNVRCFDMVSTKQCFPAVSLNITSFTKKYGPKIVRGYNATIEVSIAVENQDSIYNVIPVANPRENFAIELSFLNSLSKRRKRATTSDVGPFTVVVFGNTSAGLPVGATKTYTGTVQFLIPRDKCSSLHFICGGVAAGSGASYTITGPNPISCINFYPLKNCQGVPVTDPYLSANTTIIPTNSTIRTEVKWSQGTDVVYKLDFGDGQSFSWDWQNAGHIYNYSSAMVSIAHTYVIYGNFTLKLNISNNLNSTILTVDILVEPILVQHVTFKDIWRPQPIPSVVNIQAALISPTLYHGPFKMWCDAEFDDNGSPNSARTNVTKTISLTPSLMTHTYAFDKPDANLTLNCSNHVSKVNFKKRVILREPITNLTITSSATILKTGSQVTFYLTLKTGSHAVFDVNFGDDTTKTVAHPNIYSAQQMMNITHVYSVAGNYSVNATAYNIYHHNNSTLPEIIIVQNEVKDIQLVVPAILQWSSSPLSVTVRSTGSAPYATDPSCHWQRNDSTIGHHYQSELTTGADATKSVPIGRTLIGHNISFNILCYNLVSSVTLQKSTAIYEKILALRIIGQSAIVPGSTLKLISSMTNGSNVQFEIKDGLGNTINANHPSLLAFSEDFSFNLTYHLIGNYTVTVQASNRLGSETQTHNVVVQNSITDFTYWANDSVLYTPGEVTYQVIVGSSQSALKNIHCTWKYNDRYDDYFYHDNLNAGDCLMRSVTFDRTYLGLLNTTVNCSNLVSSLVKEVQTEIILDAVVLGSFETNGSVFITNITFFTINITRFGVAPQSCFHLDLGDGIQQIMFGLSVCAPDATKIGIPFEQIAYGTMIIEYDYEYKSVNNFNAKMFAYNHVSNHTLTTVAVVKAWTCFAPNITDLDNFTDISKPLVKMKSRPFTIMPGLELDCMITDVSVHLWKVTSTIDKKTVVHNQTSGQAFNYTVRLLPYGLWQLDYTASMKDNPGTDKNETIYLEIVKSPLDINIGGNHSETLEFTKPFTLNALNYSFDHDIEPHDKSGLVFKWNCTQHNSTFQAESIDATSLDTQMQDVLKYRQTCFGRQTKDLDVTTSGVFNPDTSLMLPKTWYHIGLTVTKDTRTGTSDKWLYVKDLSAPIIQIRCVENCGPRKGHMKRVVLDVSCSANCKSRLGGLTYEWSLVVNYENGTNEKIGNLSDWTEAGINKQNITFKKETLRAGENHTVSVITFTPGSSTSRRNLRFLVNKPPFQGTCKVSPLEGISSVTNFIASCLGWKEFQPVGGLPTLRYDFGISYPSDHTGPDSLRVFPVEFGSSPQTEEVKFPVGAPDKSFKLNVVAKIVDQTEDYYQFIFDVKVNPRPETLSSVLGKVGEQVGTELKNLSQAGNYRKAAAMAFSLSSELNVPDKYYVADSNSTVSLQQHKETKAKIRTNIIAEITTFPVNEPEELLQNTEVMRNAMAVKDELEIEALGTGTKRLEGLTDSFRNFKANGKVKNVKLMSNDLVGLSVKCMSAADYLRKVANKPKVADNETMLNSTTGNSTLQNEANQSNVTNKVQDVMRSVVNVVHNISSSLAEDMNPGDQDESMVFDEVTLLVSMAPTDQLMNETQKNTKQGSIKFRNPKDLFGSDAPKCLESQMFFTSINPFIYGNGSENNVNSSVLDIQMISCDHKIPSSSSRKKRAVATELKPKVTFDVSLIPTNLPEPIQVFNKSQYDGYIYHGINISVPLKPVQVFIKHNLNFSLEMYIGINQKPNDKENFRNFTVIASQSFLLSVEEMSNFVNDSINGTIYVSVRSSACNTAPTCNGEDGTLTYSLVLYSIECQSWDKTTEAWNTLSCKIEKESTPEKVIFKSNLFGSLGTGLFQAPNKIDFGTVFDNLGAKIVENMPVVATVIGVILLYIAGLVWCRKLDKADALKWEVLPLIGNIADTGYEYEVHIYTGFKRHSETDSKVHINIFGAYGSTGNRELTDVEKRKNFRRGECSSFLLSSSTDLGKLYSINVWHDSSGDDWYLTKIIAVDHTRNQWYQFICNKWLSTEKEDKKTVRTLDVAIMQSHVNAGVLMRNNMSRKLFDDHLWLSVAYRKSRSRFTRAQRLSCCVALLYLTMIGNAMWYKAPDEGGGASQALHLGPITISVAMLAASIYSSLVVVPPIMLITFFFSKSRDKPKVIDNNKDLTNLYHNYYYGKKLRKPESPVVQKQEKKPFSMPYWCIAFGWILVFLSVAASAFFTILYSFQWGGVKSTGWLVAFVLSFFESVVIIQPVKVMLIVMVLSLMFKKDVDVDEYEENYGEMQNWYDIYNDKEISKLRREMPKDIKDDDTAKLRRLDSKVSIMMKEIVSNFFIVMVMLCVAYISYDPNMYQQNANLKSVLVKNADPKVEHFLKVWPWVQQILLPSLYYTEDYNGKAGSDYEKKFTADGLALRFGPPRLRQLRVSTENCKIRKDIRRFSMHCVPWFVSKHGDKDDYLTNWTTPINGTKDDPSIPTNVIDAFKYRSGPDMKVLPYWATFEVLPGGGYVANLGNNKKGAEELVKHLKSMQWIDERTRALFAEFNIYNANTELFTQVILAFEFPPTGGVQTWHTFSTIQLYRYTGPIGLFSLIMEVVSLIVFLVLVIFCIKNIITNRKEYLRNFWNWVRMLALLLYAIAVVVYAVKMKWTIQVIEYMMNHKEETVSFQHVTLGDQIFLSLFGLVIFLLTLGFLNILRFNWTIAVLGQVLAASVKDLVLMSLNVFIIVMAFASMGHTLFGPYLSSYKDLADTLTTLSTNFLGSFNYQEISENTGNAGKLFLLCYLITMIFIVINLFITMLCTFLDAVRSDTSGVPKDHEVVDHLLDMVQGFVVQEKSDKEKSDNDEFISS